MRKIYQVYYPKNEWLSKTYKNRYISALMKDSKKKISLITI